MANPPQGKRLFVGNLFPEVANVDLERLFAKFGTVNHVEIKSRKDIDGQIMATFAFINASMVDAQVQACIRELNGLKWKKHNLKVQVAQESFMQRLDREREQRIKGFSNQAPEQPDQDTPEGSHQAQERSHRAPERSDQGLNRSDQGLNRSDQGLNRSDQGLNRSRQELNRPDFAPDQDSEYDPMSHMKNQMKGIPPSQAFKKADLGDQESQFINRPAESVDETVPGVGKAKDGLVTFSDHEDDFEEESGPNRRPKVGARRPQEKVRKRYHSSSDDDEPHGESSVPLVPRRRPMEVVKSKGPMAARKPLSSAPKPSVRKRYYSSSDEEVEKPKERDLKFSSEFWGDLGDESEKRSNKQSYEQNFQAPTTRPQEDANEKRLRSLKQRQADMKKAQMKPIKVDHLSPNKKIRFEDAATKSDSKSRLFDSDESEDEAAAAGFKVKAQFEGKSGEKLLALQSRIAATDERFKIDSRFREPDDDGDLEDDDDEPMVEGEEDAEQEKRRNLKLLEAMMSSKKAAQTVEEPLKREKKSVLFKDASKMRFDPDDPTHAKKFEKTAQSDDSSEDESKPPPVLPKETPMPTVNEERSYFLKKDVFSKSENQAKTSGFAFGFGGQAPPAQGFSLLNKFGRGDYETKDIKKASDKKSKLGFLERNPFKYDSSSEDEGGKDEETPQKKTLRKVLDDKMSEFARNLAQKSNTSKLSESFFFVLADKRLAEGVEFLSHGQTLDQSREKYEQARPILAGILKKKRKSRMKKAETLKFQAKKKKKTWTKGGGKGRGKARQ